MTIRSGTLYTSALIFSLVATQVACNNAKQDSAASQSFIMKGVQWADGVAQVCWITPGYEDQKSAINRSLPLKAVGRSI